MAYCKQRRKPTIVFTTILCVFLTQCIISRSVYGALDSEVYRVSVAEDDPSLGLEISNPQGRTRVVRSPRQKRETPASTQQQYLDAHNNARASVIPTATNMLKMKWSNALATVAENYAKKCIWGHNAARTTETQALTSDFNYVGENLYLTSQSSANPVSVVQSWDDEKSDYTYSSNTCNAVCGHYTQVVWASSEYVGCAAHTCSSFTGVGSAFDGGTIVVCNYGPGGNFNNQRPYLTGTACSACPSEYTCSNNLCMAPDENVNTGPEVFSIDPHFGSACGETRITISGKKFSLDKLNEGNEVELVSATTSYECLVNKDGTMEDSIMCYTVPGMVEGVYTVKVTVDGVPIPDDKLCKTGGSVDSDCQFEVRKQNTPVINSVTPVAFPPGPESILEMRALMFTDRYTTNVATSSNGREETINRVYAGPLLCDLIKTGETDVFYGLQLDSSSSDYGTMKCRYQGNFIGNSNASFIVGGGPFGRSCRNLDTLLVSINKQIYQFQTYAEIAGVAPATGSTSGGTTLKITGNYFTGSMANTKVYVGGVLCEVSSVTDTEIQCVTPPKPATLPTYFCGNRGLTLEVWTGQTKAYADLVDIEALTSSDAGYSVHQTGQSYFSHAASNYVSRAQGFFTAPYSGEYSFTIKSADVTSLRLSTDMNPANKVEIAKCEGTCPEYSSTPGQTSARVTLTEQQKYYMEILHSHGSSGDPSVQVATQFYDTKLTNQSTGIVDVEHQLVKVRSTVVREVQKISLGLGTTVGSIINEVQMVEVKELSGQYSDATFRLGLYGVYTEPLNTNMDNIKIATAVQSLPWYGNSGELIGVSKTEATSPDFKITLKIQFFSKRGDIPLLEYLVYDGSQGEKLEVQVTEDIKGNPEPYTLTLQMEGVVSPVIPGGSDITAVITAVDQMFTTRCPKYLGATGVVHISFETNSNTAQGGQIVDDKEAFCGRKSVKNPSYLYSNNDGLLLGSGVNTICFAYHGALASGLVVKYSYKAGEDMTSVDNKYRTFSISIAEESDQWKYTCFDMLTALTNLVTDGQLFRVHYIKASRSGDVYIDEVYIGNGPTTKDQENVNLLRLKPVKPNGHVIHLTEGVVTSNAPPVFSVDITFIPLECGYDFPLLSAVPGQV